MVERDRLRNLFYVLEQRYNLPGQRFTPEVSAKALVYLEVQMRVAPLSLQHHC